MRVPAADREATAELETGRLISQAMITPLALRMVSLLLHFQANAPEHSRKDRRFLEQHRVAVVAPRGEVLMATAFGKLPDAAWPGMTGSPRGWVAPDTTIEIRLDRSTEDPNGGTLRVTRPNAMLGYFDALADANLPVKEQPSREVMLQDILRQDAHGRIEVLGVGMRSSNWPGGGSRSDSSRRPASKSTALGAPSGFWRRAAMCPSSAWPSRSEPTPPKSSSPKLDPSCSRPRPAR
jgi:hypothetical protein